MFGISIGDTCVGNTQIKEWYKWFKDGHPSVDSDPLSGQLSTARTNDDIECV